MSTSNTCTATVAGTISLPDANELKFTCFPKMPLELRDKVWKHTLTPRLVHWRPGGGKALAVFAINKESRKATSTKYVLCHFPLRRHGQYSIFINFDIDTIYRHQRGLPHMVRQYNFPCQAIDIPDTFTTSKVIKADLFWNVQPWIRFLKSLTIDLETAAARPNSHQLPRLYRAGRTASSTQTIWVKIKSMCPDLKKLKVFLGGKMLDKGVQLEDLTEVRDLREPENDVVGYYDGEKRRAGREYALAQVVRGGYEKCQNGGHLLGLRLVFAKLTKRGAAESEIKARARLVGQVGTSVGPPTCATTAEEGCSVKVNAQTDTVVQDWDEADAHLDVSASQW